MVGSGGGPVELALRVRVEEGLRDRGRKRHKKRAGQGVSGVQLNWKRRQ